VLVAAIVLAVVAVASLAVAVAAVTAARRRPELPAPAAPPRPRWYVTQPLSGLVVEALDEGVVVLDHDDHVVLLNPAARAMSVVDVDRVVFPALVDAANRARESGRTVSLMVDLPIGRLGREPIALSVNAVPLEVEPGDDRTVALLLADMSEHRRLEAVRRDFVANVSHELKTPVGALTLLAEAVQDAKDDPDAVARFAGRMQQEGSRLARLVQELMELSRVQGADPMPGAAEVKVARMLAEATDRTRLAAEQADITVDVDCPDETILVRGNEAQLSTAVSNLVDNALAYSAAGTRVVVSARASADQQSRPLVEITVTDQGIGIAEADLDRIFERFYRVDPARTRATGGTGLGLALVKNIVTNHLGTVSVESAVGKGSTFTIRLPRVHPRASSFQPKPAAPVSRLSPASRGSEGA
jgi:two-component system sensor histidine kinase SenX3